MGNWKIEIKGTGCHHNKNHAGDADRRARDLVDQLIRDNHTVQSAQFSVLDGSGEEVTGDNLLPETPECPCCHSRDRVTVSPAESRYRGAWFCPCNEPGQNPSGHFDVVNPAVSQTKRLRSVIKDLVAELNAGNSRKSRSRALTITKLEEASMWLGKDLQELNEPNPYPNSTDQRSPVIDQTAPEACSLN